MDVSGNDVTEISKSSNPIMMYRGLSVFRVENDEIDFTETIIESTDDMIKYFEVPQRVNQKCAISTTASANIITTDCPFESGVSGGALYTILDRAPFALALAAKANNDITDTRDGTMFENISIIPPLRERFCG